MPMENDLCQEWKSSNSPMQLMERLKVDRSLLPLHLKKERWDASFSLEHLIPAAASGLEKDRCSFCCWHYLRCSGIGNWLLFPSLEPWRTRIFLPHFWKRLSIQSGITVEMWAWSWLHLSGPQAPWCMIAFLVSCQEAQKTCKLLTEKAK